MSKKTNPPCPECQRLLDRAKRAELATDTARATLVRIRSMVGPAHGIDKIIDAALQETEPEDTE